MNSSPENSPDEELLKAFKAAGVTELAIRLYDDPESSIRLIAERVMPALA